MSNNQPTQVATAPQQTTAMQKKPDSVATLMQSPGIMAKVQNLFDKECNAAGFISSVISVTNGNSLLRKADPMTVVGAAMVAATLQLPIIPTLGLAYIVPYKGQAQFQIGYKGLIELAERSGQFRNIIDEVVCEGQLIKKNRFTGEYIFDEDAKTSDKVIGYMARFDLINGFSKTIYWSVEDVKRHATKFSQAFRSGTASPWKSDFDAMARKTVLKALFKYAPKSISTQMVDAIRYDQAVVKATPDTAQAAAEAIEIEAFPVEYIDNPEEATADDANKAPSDAMQRADKAMAAATAKKPTAQAVDRETGELIEETDNTQTK